MLFVVQDGTRHAYRFLTSVAEIFANFFMFTTFDLGVVGLIAFQLIFLKQNMVFRVDGFGLNSQQHFYFKQYINFNFVN